MDNARAELVVALQKEAELARRRSQQLVQIARRLSHAQEQNDLISMALAEGRSAEVFDRALQFLGPDAKP